MLTPTKIFQHYYFLEQTWLRHLIFVLGHQIVHNVCFGWYSSVSIKHILVWKINCLNYYFHAIFMKSVIVRSNSTTTSVCPFTFLLWYDGWCNILSDIGYMINNIQYMMYKKWFTIYNIWWIMCDIRYMICNI